MDSPRPEKVAVVEEVRGRFDASAAAVLTEYRGLSVSEMAELRRVLRVAGADYKIYKNTLVKLAVTGRQDELLGLLSGPVGIAFVSGEVSAVAKALRDYARANPALVLKGGLHADGLLSAQELGVLADLPSREVLLSRFAGGLAAPMQQLAGLMQALPRNLAYGLKQLLEQRGGDVASEVASEGQPPEASTEGQPTEASSEGQPTEAAEEADEAGRAQSPGGAEEPEEKA